VKEAEQKQPNTALHRTPPVLCLCKVHWLCSSGVAGELGRWAAGQRAFFQPNATGNEPLYAKAGDMDTRNDFLTGFFNRNHWLILAEELLAQSKKTGSVVAIIYVDIDGFKPFNDINGLQSGDRLITALAQLIHSLLPEGTIASRYGGDEFLMAVPERTEAEVSAVAEAIRQQAKKVVVLGGYYDGKDWDAAPVTLTLGLSFYPQHGGDLRSLIIAAEEATLQGKKAKGDCVISLKELS
jgi:diguanylate cyclase (GGDEF)-like protein